MINDLLMSAWGVIANVSGGDWTQQTAEWQEAAAIWRANFHMTLDALPENEGHTTDPYDQSGVLPEITGFQT